MGSPIWLAATIVFTVFVARTVAGNREVLSTRPLVSDDDVDGGISARVERNGPLPNSNFS